MPLLNPVSATAPRNVPIPATIGDLFDEPTYAAWVKAAMREKQRRPELSVLFDSTIAEPTEHLGDLIRRAFGQGLSSRFVSVFADGNPFAIAAVKARYGFASQHLITTTGATAAMTMAIRAFVGPGETVLVERPGFDALGRIVTEAGGIARPLLRHPPAFGIDREALERQLDGGVRAIIITNLHNPSGALLSAADVREVATVAARVGALVLVDEVYADFAGDAFTPGAQVAANVISVSSLTKVFGLFALKFGWIAATPELISELRRHAPDGDIGVSKLSHAVAAHVLEEPQPFDAHWRDTLARTRPVAEAMCHKLTAQGLLLGDLPAHGCMYFPQVVGCADTRTLARRLMAEFGVLVAPGEYFDMPGHIRIGFGGDAAALEAGLAKLTAGLSALAR